MRQTLFALILALNGVLWSSPAKADDWPVFWTGGAEDGVGARALAGRLCSHWLTQDWEAFAGDITKYRTRSGEPVTLSQIYFELACNGSGQENLTVMRLAMESPVDYWTETNKIIRLFLSEPGGSQVFTCVVAHTLVDNWTLIEFVEESIAAKHRDLDRTVNRITDPDTRVGMKRMIQAWERRLAQFRDHVAAYPVDPDDCPVFGRFEPSFYPTNPPGRQYGGD